MSNTDEKTIPISERRGKVLSLNTSETKGVPKKPVDSVELVVESGIKDDAHAGTGHRQISLLAKESADKLAALGVKGLSFGIFAENITTEGIELFTLPVGTRLQIGETLHEVSQIGKECHTGCAIKQQVGFCVMPTEGIFTRVLQGGTVKVGDKIVVVE